MSYLVTLGTFLLMFLSFFMIVLILLQRGRGGGLAGAFGGMGSQSAFGTKAGDTFTRITIIVAIIWVVLAGGLGMAMRKVQGNRNQGALLPSGTAELKSGDAEDGARKPDLGTAAGFPPTGSAPAVGTPDVTVPPVDMKKDEGPSLPKPDVTTPETPNVEAEKTDAAKPVAPAKTDENKVDAPQADTPPAEAAKPEATPESEKK